MSVSQIKYRAQNIIDTDIQSNMGFPLKICIGVSFGPQNIYIYIYIHI